MSTAEPGPVEHEPTLPSTEGRTRIPRWVADHGAPGVRWQRVPEELSDGLRRLAATLGVASESVLYAAHVKVLAVLCGQDEVTACLRRGEHLHACRTRLGTESWSELIRRVDVALLAARDNGPVTPQHRPEAEAYETAVGLRVAGAAGPHRLEPALAIDVELVCDEGGWLLGVYHQADVADAGYADRIGGYHLTALGRLLADPDGEHQAASLPDEAELHHQLHQLSGPRRAVGEHGLPTLFERCAARFAHAEAAAHGQTRWSYDVLNTRANQVAAALLDEGLRCEQVVGVIAHRGLDWLASVLAVFKAGGAYLPIEPDLPPERIRTMLRRSGCTLLVCDEAGAAVAAELGTGATVLRTSEAFTAGRAPANPQIAIRPDQLAYVYFTSGSTGEPKGAMCEHAGMLNHLFAKIDDLGITEGSTVAQTAPQCFDISLWQLVAGLLVGARTVIADQEVVKDVDRLLDLLDDEAVNVVQLVPSYLEVLLTRVAERPRELGALRHVSVTGEAVKRPLVQRWFDTFPHVGMLNAYGLTETCDDTNHEMMRQVPDGAQVPLGRPVNNVTVYVVDEQLRPVPLGAPGEIVFSGVCVGRGYINDPERSRDAFLTDPHRPGTRLYRSGDLGRWRPDGKLEFLGRRDTQVKVRGLRIELGEIENRLLEHPGVRDGAVLVRNRRGSQRLIGCYRADHEIGADALRATLAASLPGYMVPDDFLRLPSFPLTGNGKVDRRALADLVPDNAGAPAPEAPRTPAERSLVPVWAAVLNIPVEQVGRDDHFFETGGTSLAAIRLVTKLGKRVSLRDIAEHPVLSGLAELLDQR